MVLRWANKLLWGSPPEPVEEHRAQDVSGIDTLLTNLDTYYATGEQANVNRTAAVEFALGMVARAFMLAEPVFPAPGLDPLTLSMLARQAVTGNAVFQVGVNRATGNLRLLPVADYEISGGVAPETWRYDIEQARPGNDDPARLNVPAQGIVHVRYMPRPNAPWLGVSPLVAAGLTAEQLAKIERSLSWESGIPAGNLLPIPDGVSDAAKNGIRNALANGKGAITPVETTAAGFGQGTLAAPRSDYDQKRFGPLIPATSLDLRDRSALAILGAMGIPPTLFTSEGSALRESYRNFFTGTIEPLGALIASELSEKLGQNVEFFFPEIVKSDISAKSRAYASLVQGQMSDAEARRIVGLPRAQ